MHNQLTTLPPALEIACDESGWEGANLVAGGSDVIAYASVRLDAEAAAECISQLCSRVGHSAIEYKASQVLRPNRRPAVAWLLGPAGPLYGNASVHLTEKSFFVVGRVLDLLLGDSVDTTSAGLREDDRLRRLALVLCRDGPAAFGGDRWRAFLAAANMVLRTRKPRHIDEPVDVFLDIVDALPGLDGGKQVGAILDELRHARHRAHAARAALVQNHMLQPALEPLIPALARTILHWCRGGVGVSVVHDEQSALTVRRIELLEQLLFAPDCAGGYLRLEHVDSRRDPRVQVADLLAGIARRVASDELNDRGDPGLCELVRPYIDPTSRWSDERSWKQLGSAGH